MVLEQFKINGLKIYWLLVRSISRVQTEPGGTEFSNSVAPVSVLAL
jgi:hypothetical protein